MMTALKNAFPFILVLFIFYSCQSTVTLNETEYSNKIRVACIGDSITYGSGIGNRSKNSYPSRLQEKLGEDYYVVNFGVNGATLLKEGNKAFWNLDNYKTALKFNADIVIIKLGTNDSKKKNWRYSKNFKSDYIDFIRSFRKLNRDPEIYISLPAPAYSKLFGISNKTISTEIIPIISTIDEDTVLIDLNTPLLNKEIYFPDGVHPDRHGAEVIANIVFDSITK